MRFLGNIEAKTDAKGRVFLPAAFRKVLQQEGVEQLVLRKDVHENCLVLFPDSVWNEQEDALRQKLNRWNKQHQQLFRRFVSDVETVGLDGNGRFLIPRRFMELAGITQTVRFIGVGDTIEIWAEAEYDKFAEHKDDFAEALEGLMTVDN
ncbi:MAG: division/cell wall cluster transcriptional repressor MraZ [Prevotella sp.]|nr:division/cell wall cluster transcriptional repressor MraZ [Prevotella sp.]MBR1839991.1 division/cell wall cluster transcriptional repressor MraZ [Prevotella sp.]